MEASTVRSFSSTPAESIEGIGNPLPSIGLFKSPTATPPNPDLKRFNHKQYRRCHLERRKRPRTGWYWQHGSEWEDTDHRDAPIKHWACNYCRQFQPYRSEGTANIIQHLYKTHNIRENLPTPASSQDISRLVNRTSISKADRQELKRRTAREALIDWFTHDHIPYGQVESPRFRRFCLSISDDSEDLIPRAHSTVTSWILDHFKAKKSFVVDALARSRSRIHFSFDLWTSPFKNIALLGTMAHFLTSDYMNTSVLLSLRPLRGIHSGENIAEIILETLHEYRIHEIGWFVSDNHGANDTAVQQICESFHIPEQADGRRLRCLGHIINLTAQAFLFGKDTEAFEADDWDDLAVAYQLWQSAGPIGQVHYIFTFIRSSSQRREDFLNLQDDLHALTPLTNNQTRWNSTFIMLQRAIKLRKTVDLFCLQYIDSKKLPENARISDETWSLIGQICEILEHFSYATLTLEGAAKDGHHGSLWECLPMIETLLRQLERLKVQYPLQDENSAVPLPPVPTRRGRASQSTRRIPTVSAVPATTDTFLSIGLNNAWKKLDKYYLLTDKSPAYVLAVVLNPQYKWKYFEKMWALHPDWIVTAKTKVQTLWDDYKSRHPVLQDEVSLPVRSPSKHRRQHMTDYAREILEDSDDEEIMEMDEYSYYCSPKEERVRMVDGVQFKPVAWWEGKQARYRTLSRLAFDLLAIPAMSAEPERLFSSTRRLVTWERNKLDGGMIEANECLRNWACQGELGEKVYAT